MSHRIRRPLLSLFAACLLTGSVSVQAALSKNTFCIFDPVGNNGDVLALMKDYKTEALSWGVDLDLKTFMDESVIVDELKAGQCDAAAFTGLKTRAFNRFTSTVEAVGALPDYKTLRTTLQTLMSPKAAKLMRNGPYEVAGIMPAGAIYAFVKDREWDSLNKIQGKKIIVMEGDDVSQQLVRQVGGTPVSGNTTNFAGKFNNGSVDVTFAPAVAYEPLEMYKGLEPGGGVVDHIFIQLTFQMVIRHDRFPEEFGQKSRQMALANFDRAFAFIGKATDKIDDKYWVEPNPAEVDDYQQIMREARIALRDQSIYDARMLKLMRKVRCKYDPVQAECAEKLE